MAQTQTKPRGQSISQQEAPREAPRGQAVTAAGNSTRGLSAAERGTMALRNMQAVSTGFREEVEAWATSLVDNMTPSTAKEVAFFKQVLATAAAEKPELYFADRRTLFTAARKCFLDGCLPDGRDAALVVYPNTRIKVRGPDGVDTEVRIDAVQYMPMVRGIVRRMLESGGVTSCYADAVYEKDRFEHHRGDTPRIIHETPGLGQDRGKLLGAYAVIRLANGDTLLDSMGEREIMAAKSKSRAGDSSMLWKDFPWEAYKKTVLRRLSKMAPVSPNIHRLVDREDDPITGEIGEAGTSQTAPRYEYPAYQVHAAEPEPQAPLPDERQTSQQQQQRELDRVEFSITDTDGVVHTFSDPFRAFDAATAAITTAATVTVALLDGFWESNQEFLDELSASGNGNLSTELAQRYADARDNAEANAAEAAKRQEETERAAAAARETERLRQEEAAAEEKRAGERQAQGSAEATGGPPKGEQATGAAPDAGPVDEAPFPGDQPSRGAPADDRPRDMPAPITVPLKGGKPDYRTFAIALIRPKIKTQKTTNDLALLLGANEEALARCRAPGTLDRADLEALEGDIKAAFDKLAAAGV